MDLLSVSSGAAKARLSLCHQHRSLLQAMASTVGLPDEPWDAKWGVEGLCGLPAAALHSVQQAHRSIPAVDAMIADYPPCVKLLRERGGRRAGLLSRSVILSEAKNLLSGFLLHLVLLTGGSAKLTPLIVERLADSRLKQRSAECRRRPRKDLILDPCEGS